MLGMKPKASYSLAKYSPKTQFLQCLDNADNASFQGDKQESLALKAGYRQHRK